MEKAHEGLPTLRSISGLLILECVFALAGGYMDAYAFIACGHVFANAQTGNIIFFAVYFTQGNWAQSARHASAICACLLGVATAELIGVQPEKRTFRATLICTGLEFIVLAALGIVDSRLPNIVTIPILSFVAAIQFTAFDSLGPWSFNSAMTTGNLKSATVGIVLWLRGEDRERNRGKFIVSTIACMSFLAGALIGGVCTRLHPRHALLPCATLILISWLIIWRAFREHRVQNP